MTHARALAALFTLLAAGIVAAACSTPVSYPDGVIVDTVKYDRTEFFRGPQMNLVFELRQGDFDADGAPDVLAVAGDGIHVLGMDGREKRFAAFQAGEAPWAVRVVPGSPDGTLRFLGNLPKLRQTVVFDEAGRVVWTAPGGPYDEPIAADVDGDGRAEILSPVKGGFEVRTLDGRVLQTFTAAGRPMRFDAADMDGDARADLIAEDWTNGRNEMRILALDGRALARWTSPHVFDRFSVAVPPGGSKPALMLLGDGVEELVFLDLQGAVVRTLKAPSGNHLSQPRGMRLRVAGDDGGFVCLGTSKGGNHHHIAYVYDARGDLVYADSADDDALAVLALNDTAGGRPSFLVGSRNVIWKYTERAGVAAPERP